MPLFRPKVIPHGFTKFESVNLANPAMSETRLVCVNVGIADAADARRKIAPAAHAKNKTKSIRATLHELIVFTSSLLFLASGSPSSSVRYTASWPPDIWPVPHAERWNSYH